MMEEIDVNSWRDEIYDEFEAWFHDGAHGEKLNYTGKNLKPMPLKKLGGEIKL